MKANSNTRSISPPSTAVCWRTGACIAELARLKGEGVLIELTMSGPRQAEVLERAMSVEVDGVRLFDAVRATWNLLEPSAAFALETAHASALGVIVKEALANGRLTIRNRDPEFAGRQHALATLAAALARPWADVVLSGAATPEQLSSNLRSLEVSWDEEAELQALPLAEEPEAYWRRRSDLAWN